MKITRALITGIAAVAFAAPAVVATATLTAAPAQASPCGYYYYGMSPSGSDGAYPAEDSQYVLLLKQHGLSNTSGPDVLIQDGHSIVNDICRGGSPLHERDLLFADYPGLGVDGANNMVNDAVLVYLGGSTSPTTG
jgi:hypothetical protein